MTGELKGVNAIIEEAERAGTKYVQADGAEVFWRKRGKDQNDFVVIGEDGTVVTAMEDMTNAQMQKFARSWGWTLRY